MSLHIIPEMDMEYIEAVLNTLPEPSSVEIAVVGNTGPAYDAARKVFGEAIGFPDRLGQSYSRVNQIDSYVLNGATKEEIMNMIRARNETNKNFGSGREDEADLRALYEHAYPHFLEATWNLPANLSENVSALPRSKKGDVSIKLTTYQLSIEYSGEEPAYVSKLMQRLAGLRTKIEIGNF